MNSTGSPSFFLATIYAASGENEETLRCLRIAVDDHEMEIPWLISEPQFYDLHSFPAFKEMVKEVGFPV